MSKKYASRAGEKLQHAFKHFNIDVSGKLCADFGCSTGGFVDCLLQNGAVKVYAVDTGYGVLDWKLRQNDNVVVMERTNALHVKLPEPVDLITIDVSWTPQKLIIPVALSFLNQGGDIISLLKPHYEAEKSWLTKGKLEEKFISATMDKVMNDISKLNVELIDLVESPIVGKKGGNKEFLIWLKAV